MRLYFSLLQAFLSSLLRKKRQYDSKNIVIIRLDQIGDFFLWLPYAKLLRNHFKDYRITLVVNEILMDTAQTLLAFDEYIPIAPKQFLQDHNYRRKIKQNLSKHKFAIAINPRISRYVLLDDLIQLWCNAEKNFVFGYTPDQAYHWKIKVFQKLIDRYWILVNKQPVHELENNDLFCRAILKSEFVLNFQLTIPHVPGLPEQYFVLLPGAGCSYKKWNAKNFGTIARRICEKYPDMYCIVCGGSEDAETAEHILSMLPGEQGISLCGKTTIPESVAVIQKAKLVIGNDTGGIHIAALAGTPSIALVGGGGFKRFLPYPEKFADRYSLPSVVTGEICNESCTWNCSQTHDDNLPRPCIESINVEDVWNQVLEIFQKSNI